MITLYAVRVSSVSPIVAMGKTIIGITGTLPRYNSADIPTTESSKLPESLGSSQKIRSTVRVRKARVSDAPRVLRFVREHAASCWPGCEAPPLSPATCLVLADYVARILAQGRTLLAEQQEVSRGCRKVVGLALGAKQCAWDAALLEKWASCVPCPKSRNLLRVAALCLKEPALHEKYKVGEILQVLILVSECKNNAQVCRMLAKAAIKRGKDSGYPLMRFDATDATMAAVLEKLKLKKEWQLPTHTLEEIDSSGQIKCNKLLHVYSARGAAVTVHSAKP